MKIGILTFHCAYNFGAILQAYALQQQLQLMGHDAYILDYRPDYLTMEKCPLQLKYLLRHPRKRMRNRHLILSIRRHFAKFSRFEKKYYRLASTNGKAEHFDVIVIGSDQVWNRRYNGSDDPIWYGTLPEGITATRIVSYAASAGDAGENEFEKSGAAERMRRLDRILVREERLAEVLRECGIASEQVVDPTLLADSQIWQKWTGEKESEKYVVVYQGREHPDVFRIANEIAKEYGCKVVSVDWWKSSYAEPGRHKDISPDRFINMISRCKCVVTSSFHGTALSIVCGTPFYSIRINDGADERVMQLLKDLNLEDRFINTDSTPKFSPIDYKDALDRLHGIRTQSLTKLSQAIEE